MKKKFLPLISLMAAMALVACGGGNNSKAPDPSSEAPASSEPAPSSEAPASSSQAPASSSAKPSSSAPASSSTPAPSSSTPAPSSSTPASSSEAPVAEMAVTNVQLTAKEGSVYLKLAGTAANFGANDFKFALGLAAISDNQGTTGDFVYGKAEPADADYNIPVAIANGAFEVEIKITGLEGVVPGLYKVFVGPKGFYGTIASTVEGTTGATSKDSTNAYYLRSDGQCGNVYSVAVDELPPFVLTEASVFEKDGEIFAKIGGETNITKEIAETYTPFINFQQVGGSWTNTGHDARPATDIPYTWDFETAGKGYIVINVSFFKSGTNYNTHLNFKTKTKADCKMAADLNQDYKVGKLQVTVFSNTKGTAQDDFWGNLAFKVTDNPDYVAHWGEEPTKTVTNADGKSIKEYADDMGNKRIAIDVKDYSSTSDGAIKSNDAKGIKLNKGGSLTYKVDVAGLRGGWNTAAEKKVKLIVGDTPGSDNHVKRHLWNDALPIPEGAPEGTSAPFNEGTADKDTEDAWRIGVKVNGEAVAITNYATLAENGLENGKLGYIALCEIKLVNGTNTIEISQNNIGYSFVFGGEVRMEWKGTDSFIADYEAPAEA